MAFNEEGDDVADQIMLARSCRLSLDSGIASGSDSLQRFSGSLSSEGQGQHRHRPKRELARATRVSVAHCPRFCPGRLNYKVEAGQDRVRNFDAVRRRLYLFYELRSEPWHGVRTGTGVTQG